MYVMYCTSALLKGFWEVSQEALLVPGGGSDSLFITECVLLVGALLDQQELPAPGRWEELPLFKG